MKTAAGATPLTRLRAFAMMTIWNKTFHDNQFLSDRGLHLVAR